MRYVSTRNTSKTYEFKDVFIKGLADDGGLFIPSSLPNYSEKEIQELKSLNYSCLLYTSPSPRDISGSRMPSSA